MAAMGISRREAKAAGKLVGKVGESVGRKIDESNARFHAEAAAGDNSLVRELRKNAERFRADAERDLAAAAEAEAKGKDGKAARLRKVGERELRQAEEYEAKADAEAEKAQAWAAEHGA